MGVGDEEPAMLPARMAEAVESSASGSKRAIGATAAEAVDDDVAEGAAPPVE